VPGVEVVALPELLGAVLVPETVVVPLVPVAVGHGPVLLALVPVPLVPEVLVAPVLEVFEVVVEVLELVLEPNSKACSCSSRDCKPPALEPLELPEPLLATLVPELEPYELELPEPCPEELELEPLEPEPCPPPSQDQGHPRPVSPATPKPLSPESSEPPEPSPQGLDWTLT
jgi:hypothetical protein